METYVDRCLSNLGGAREHTENMRVAYKQHLYQRCDAQASKAIAKVEDIMKNPDLLDDDLSEMIRLARGFERLSIPLVCHYSISHSNKIHAFPSYHNFASLLFYIYETGNLFIERCWSVKRICGKKMALQDLPHRN